MGGQTCEDRPCENGATCLPVQDGAVDAATNGRKFTCLCQGGFTGVTCSHNACLNDPCLNGKLFDRSAWQNGCAFSDPVFVVKRGSELSFVSCQSGDLWFSVSKRAQGEEGHKSAELNAFTREIVAVFTI